jgi:tetratricopeptide (TPR) repeat protein
MHRVKGLSLRKLRALLVAGSVIMGISMSLVSCSNIQATKHFETGKRYAKNNQYDRAIEEFEQAVEANPKHDQALEAIGLIYGTLSMYEKAEGYFERALELQPENKLYLQNCAITYVKLEKHEEAKKLYLRLLAIDKDDEAAKQQLQVIEEKGY